jgi:hypothetical protein
LLSPGITRAGASGGLLAGAVVTVYPDPPSPASDESFIRYAEVLRAGPAVGLLEESGGAAPRFDRLRTVEDLASWRRRAAAARRCGVYPVAGVLTATVVTGPAGGATVA